MADGPDLIIDIKRKRFGGGPDLFSDFKATIAGGSIVALVGPSGIGKSTLLRLIAGIDSDFEGKILIGGTAAAIAPPAGFVFQDSRLLPWLTAIENIRAARPGTTEAEAARLLARVGLSGDGATYPHALSGGMQRRVALARAISVNPHLLLLDEPFVSLDRQLVREIENLFVEVMDGAHATVLLVTHLPEDAATLADRAIILGGRPVEIRGDLVFSSPRPVGRVRPPEEVIRLSALISSYVEGTRP